MNSYKEHLYALIVAGGGGTRLWPKSRNATAKQFLKLFENKTLTQITAHRFNKIIPWENIIVEPLRKNTAPAHGIGAAYIYKKDKDAVILNESADHLVNPDDLYFETLHAAAGAAC